MKIDFPASLKAEQKKAIMYLVGTNLSKADIAERVGISVATLRTWENNPIFKETLDEAIRQIDLIDQDFRRQKVQSVLPYLYDELLLRAIDGDLEEIETKKLVDIIAKMQHEQRLDTPGEFTSKSGVGELSDVSKRYKESLSGRLHSKKKLAAESKEKGSPPSEMH